MTKILEAQQIRGVDKATIENEPIASIDLMERAAEAFFKRVAELSPNDPVVVLAGPGNNGGDALAVARMLIQQEREVRIFLVKSSSGKLSPDAEINFKRLRNTNCSITEVEKSTKINLQSNEWIVDGLFGSGLNKPVSGAFAQLISEVNEMDNKVVSIDVPSGLYCEYNTDENLKSCIKADYTISFQLPKLAFLLADNYSFVGDWEVVDIGLDQKAIVDAESPFFLTDHTEISRLSKSRNKFDHKGTFGHALLLAGSYGKMGAAVLASKACLRSGVGLLTTHIPRLGYEIMQSSVPEAMVNIDRSDILISEHPDLEDYKAIGIGPGIGTKPNTITALFELLQEVGSKALVLDADAINIISKDERSWKLLPENAILTPHPGEFDRLVGKSANASERLQKAVVLAKEKQIVLILKGAYTAVINKDGKCYFNPTGNPGMATAGSGDVLTGIVLSFLAQGYPSIDAARLAVYIHGLAADIFVEDGYVESLIASDIINHLKAAFRFLH
ncbi:NAD(P)H-hydrate dehydratase [Carboxylicivirga linearis]|uniref:Bifunctional NAD(P)H-hydrate repair enzyme n=1 Tax=Carboxylicivirga linearis TaxID=1628157 RepID=A0ABS5JR39_9BACT|nr:NAD(P)H-hydrate dehydratase [Carboxylicivirga linearis]MBS2097280.1 NAD(P)H-hydrate dehydratase [Carboxylicivirga linearis]